MWIAHLLTYCVLTAGGVQCMTDEPVQAVAGPVPEFATEFACQRSMLVSAVHSAARGYAPVVSLAAECRRTNEGA